MSDDLGDLIDQTANLRTLAPAAVGSQVLLMSVVSAATILVFNILRPRNKIVYEPKVKYHVGDKKPPRISDGIFGWVSPLIHTKEPELVDKIGLDAAVFLRFIRMMRWMFLTIAFLTSAILIPINVTYNLRKVRSKNRDVLSMLTIRDVEGNLLFAHVVVTYVICFVVMGFVWWNWRKVVELRTKWFRSPEYIQSFYARTLMLNDVTRKYQSDEGIRAIFETTQAPYPTTSVHIGRAVGNLPGMIDAHNENVKNLEGYLVQYLKGGKIGNKRPTIRIGGFLGMGGEKKDAIDYYTEKLQISERKVEDYRAQIDNRKPETYGFASLAAVPYAHIVANMLRGKRVKGATIQLAPNPKDIIWDNLSKSKAEIRSKKMMGWIFLVVVCFFNTIPLFIISILANLSSLTTFVPFLETWSDASPGTFTFISGVLPPAVSAVFGFFLPIIMRWLSQYMGATTQSRLDRAVIARYFAFLVISQLIVFTLIGVIFNSVKEIITIIGQHKNVTTIFENIDKLPETVNRTYIDQAPYWLTYFPLRGFLVLFDLAQIINLVLIWIKTRLFGRTPRDIREWTQPPEFQYAIYFSNMLFMGTVGLVFAPLAPLVAVAACVVYWVSSLVYKYQLMFVFVSQVETGGRLWNVVINRLLVSVVLMQLLMVLTIGLQYGFTSFYWVSTVPPIFIIFIFKIYLTRTFNRAFQFYVPTEEELRAAHVHSQRADKAGNRLEKRFGHPALHAELFTPMVHKNMTELLSQVYSGKIGDVKARMDEYGGTKMDARIVAGGIKIAGIDERDLEYDPALYQRDRGELDWDARSVSSSNVLADTKSIYSGRSSPAPSKALDYNRYLSQGPHSTQSHAATDNIEMSRFDGDEMPLLNAQQGTMGYFENMGRSTTSLPAYEREVPPIPAVTSGYGREAPVHRPSPSPGPGMYAGAPPSAYAFQSRGMSPMPSEVERERDRESVYFDQGRGQQQQQQQYQQQQQQGYGAQREYSPYPPMHSREQSVPLYAPEPSPTPTPTTPDLRGGAGGAPIYEQNMAGRGSYRRYGS